MAAELKLALIVEVRDGGAADPLQGHTEDTPERSCALLDDLGSAPFSRPVGTSSLGWLSDRIGSTGIVSRDPNDTPAVRVYTREFGANPSLAHADAPRSPIVEPEKAINASFNPSIIRVKTALLRRCRRSQVVSAPTDKATTPEIRRTPYLVAARHVVSPWKASRENIQRFLADAKVPSREELTAYWQRVSDDALKYIGRRPLMLVRRMGGKAYFHEGPLPPIPDAVHQLRIEKREGGEGVRVWVDDMAGLLGLVEMDVVEVHPWGATVDDVEKPDMLVFDLDPGERVPWQFVLKTALRLRDMLRDVNLDSWPKTTGGKGLHVVLPAIPDMAWPTARDYAHTIAEHFAARDPRCYTSNSSRSGRSGKVFIDYLRNGRGNTSIGAYSPRARPGFPVAASVTWRDVERGIRSDAFSITNPPGAGRAIGRKR